MEESVHEHQVEVAEDQPKDWTVEKVCLEESIGDNKGVFMEFFSHSRQEVTTENQSKDGGVENRWSEKSIGNGDLYECPTLM